MKAYEKGIIKVVWVQGDPLYIYSQMFDDKKEALKFTKDLDTDNFLIFHLEDQEKMKHFRWKLLPYGRYKMYKGFMRTVHPHTMSLDSVLRFLP